MPPMHSIRLAPLSRALTGAVFVLAAAVAHAQALPPGVHLGMSADELRAALPGLEHVQRPLRMSGGLAGNWRAAPSVIAGLPFEPVFYFAGDELRRVEWSAAVDQTPDLGAAAFGEILAWGRSSLGPELASNDPGSAYAAWVQGDTDIYAQRNSDPRHASVRLVYKMRVLQDGSEL
jgi:hypothetical protein